MHTRLMMPSFISVKNALVFELYIEYRKFNFYVTN